MVLLEQFGLRRELASAKQFFELVEHSFADARDGEDLLRFIDDVFDLLRMIFNRLRGIPVRANAERILSIDFQQVGSLEENICDGLVIHGRNKGKSDSAGRATGCAVTQRWRNSVRVRHSVFPNPYEP